MKKSLIVLLALGIGMVLNACGDGAKHVSDKEVIDADQRRLEAIQKDPSMTEQQKEDMINALGLRQRIQGQKTAPQNR